MLLFQLNDDGELKPRTWKLVQIGKAQRKSVSFTCPNGHTYLLNKYEILPNGSVHPAVLCPADGCNFHDFIKLEDWDWEAKP